MPDKKLDAINFANDFFTLINCSTTELKNYLAKDVVLDWFGETISGRCNVAEFIMYQVKNSRHIFKEILPTDTIGYRKSPSLRRKYTSVGGGLNEINDTIDDSNIPYKRKCYSDVYLKMNKDNNNQWNDSVDIVEEEETDLDNQEKMEVTENYISNELDFKKLAIDNFSTPLRVPNTNTADDNGYVLHDVALNSKIASQLRQTNINDIEKFIDKLTIKNNTLNDNNVISIANNNNQPIKYIEAYGAIEISRYYHTEQVRKDIRRRHCKLQIAYSVGENNDNDAKYDRYEKDNVKVVANSDIDFNYIIHLLIYSPNTKCRLNLSNEFEGKEFLE